MKRTPLLALLALAVLLPPVAKAIPVGDPVTISLDNPNQMTAAPSSGVTTLSFSGTITVDPNWTLFFTSVDDAFNNSQTNSLSPTFDKAFLAFFFTGTGTGTYTGNIFDIAVPAGTASDLYAYEFMSNDPSIFQIGVLPADAIVNGGPTPFTASASFSVLVTNGSAVPEGGSSALLLGMSAAGLLFVRRALA